MPKFIYRVVVYSYIMGTEPHSLSDIVELTKDEIETLKSYAIVHVEALYSRITESSNPDGMRQLLGREVAGYSLLEQSLREYLEKHNPDYLIPRPRLKVGTGALIPDLLYLRKYCDAFRRELPEMLKHHEGKWTVFKGEKPLGFYDTFETADTEGQKAYGKVPMLIWQISQE